MRSSHLRNKMKLDSLLGSVRQLSRRPLNKVVPVPRFFGGKDRRTRDRFSTRSWKNTKTFLRKLSTRKDLPLKSPKRFNLTKPSFTTLFKAMFSMTKTFGRIVGFFLIGQSKPDKRQNKYLVQHSDIIKILFSCSGKMRRTLNPILFHLIGNLI